MSETVSTEEILASLRQSARPEPPEGWVTAEEAAQALNVCRSTLRNAIERHGEFRGIRMERKQFPVYKAGQGVRNIWFIRIL